MTGVGVVEKFEDIIAADTVPGPKPSGNMIKSLAAITGLPPSAIAMVGDNHHDMEEARNGGNRFVIARPTIGRHHDRRIADIEIHMAGGDWLPIFIHMQASRWDAHNLDRPILRARQGIGIDGGIGIIIAKGFGQGQNAGGDKAGEVIDMAVRMIIEQANAEPEDV